MPTPRDCLHAEPIVCQNVDFIPIIARHNLSFSFGFKRPSPNASRSTPRKRDVDTLPSKPRQLLAAEIREKREVLSGTRRVRRTENRVRNTLLLRPWKLDATAVFGGGAGVPRTVLGNGPGVPEIARFNGARRAVNGDENKSVARKGLPETPKIRTYAAETFEKCFPKTLPLPIRRSSLKKVRFPRFSRRTNRSCRLCDYKIDSITIT